VEYSVPSWRHDIAIEEDLVEEVARHVGYENIGEELPPAYGAGEYQRTEHRESAIRRLLADQGFDEALNYSFIDTKHDEVFQLVPGLVDESLEVKFVELRDSVIEGAVRMRPTLLPGLLDSVRLNFNFQNKNLQLFELGKVFAAEPGKDGLPKERELFAIAMTGHAMYGDRVMPGRELDFYDAKGAVESALNAAGYSKIEFSNKDAIHLQKGQSASVVVNEKNVGLIGRLIAEIAANYKFRQPVYVAEIDLQEILSSEPEPIRYAALPKYPSIIRDVSFAVAGDFAFDSIRDYAANQKLELCRAVNFVDLFEGGEMADDARSLTVRFTYRSDERTLTEEEIGPIHDDLIQNLERELKISHRI
ncbi:MAG: hypothetical protein ACRD6X_21370, partial [Pyrinomonadaceae bacterium]